MLGNQQMVAVSLYQASVLPIHTCNLSFFNSRTNENYNEYKNEKNSESDF